MNLLKPSLPIARPPWPGLGRRLESSCRKAVLDYQMIEGVNKIAIALSGGKDSLGLLYLLNGLRGRGFPLFDLVAIHVDGEFTCGAGVNSSFLENICKALEVPLIIESSTQTLENLECYRCSRERRSLIFTAAKEAGAHVIAFGHHRDDNSQTLLMNLFQKGEFAGMLPKLYMHDYDVTIIRPLIYISEEDLKTFAQQYGFQRITCQCPVGQNSMRKQVDNMIDQIEQHFPHIRKNLSSASLNYGSTKAAAVRTEKKI